MVCNVILLFIKDCFIISFVLSFTWFDVFHDCSSGFCCSLGQIYEPEELDLAIFNYSRLELHLLAHRFYQGHADHPFELRFAFDETNEYPFFVAPL